MQRSIDRILTTHGGSLPRPDDLAHMMYDKLDGKPVDAARLKARVREAVAEMVRKQRAAGIDIVSDGEMSKPGFSNYIIQRFTGFGTERAQFMATDLAEFPSVAAKHFGDEGGQHIIMPMVIGPIAVNDRNAVKADIENLKAALAGKSPDEAFICAVTPGQVAFNFPNRHYRSLEDYLEAAGEALRFEYQAIIEAGFNLQLDSPDLAMRAHAFTDGKGPLDMSKYVPLAIEALNHAIRGLPADKMRLHLCWGNYVGPHHKDVELREIIAPVLKANAGFIYFEGANPRHEHEWEVWQQLKLPADKAMIPGMIDTATNHVEHPRLVAQRIERFARIVGKENVIAGTDCGFATFVGSSGVDADVAWLKLQSLAEGARIASQKLW
ncbi:MAG TPA: cobalamin-independent methionine synthase II family protein [Candidatus Binataceae bacterium]|nr:cobalamin-independent methionine synthase II family protein [Candidatus Binataceae bacterium]HVB81736.1 cobalamin-independent methionine synthase II family protein [Candidatus Binataceae bacterium]